MTDDDLMRLMLRVDPQTRRIPPGVRALANAIEAAERERCVSACDLAAQEYDACAASPLATEHGREWHRRAAEWARIMGAALKEPK